MFDEDNKRTLLCGILYIMIGFFTYGYYSNRYESERTVESYAAFWGFAWPVYWGHRIAIRSTEWAKPCNQVEREN